MRSSCELEMDEVSGGAGQQTAPIPTCSRPPSGGYA